ncbi:MAG: hypothetical protein V1837_01725 [Candidatus Woesearchaeota archaeon]
MVKHIWGFYVPLEKQTEFERLNSPAGPWHRFFDGSPDFLGTYYLKSLETVLKDEQKAREYLTFDIWKSEESFYKYIQQHKKEFNNLSEENLELIIAKFHLGWFA